MYISNMSYFIFILILEIMLVDFIFVCLTCFKVTKLFYILDLTLNFEAQIQIKRVYENFKTFQ